MAITGHVIRSALAAGVISAASVVQACAEQPDVPPTSELADRCPGPESGSPALARAGDGDRTYREIDPLSDIAVKDRWSGLDRMNVLLGPAPWRQGS